MPRRCARGPRLRRCPARGCRWGRQDPAGHGGAAARGTAWRPETRWAYGTASARSTPLGAFEGLLGDLGSDPAGIVRRAVEGLGPRSGPRPLIAIDDAHELDELSALVVHSLVVRDAAPVLVTLRSGEHSPDAITALWKDEHIPRLELQALSAVETTALLEQVLDAPVDSTDPTASGRSVRATCSFCGTSWMGNCDPVGSARRLASGSGPVPLSSPPS